MFEPSNAPNPAPASSADDEKTFCAVHPDAETGLRCNRCGRYMCARCAVYTPVGYRCRQCVNQQQDAFFKADLKDHVLGIGAAFAVALIGGLIVPRLFLLGVMLLSLPAGAAIGEAAWRASGRRRGKYMRQAVIAAIVLATAVAMWPTIQDFLSLVQEINQARSAGIPMRGADEIIGQTFAANLLPALLYAGLASFTAAGRLR